MADCPYCAEKYDNGRSCSACGKVNEMKEVYVNRIGKEEIILLSVSHHLHNFKSFAVLQEVNSPLIHVLEMDQFNFEYYKKDSIG